MPLVVNVDKQPGKCVISPNGSIDSDTFRDFERQMDEVISEGIKVIVMNMEGVVYLSSMGLGVLIKTKKMAEKNGSVYIMANLQPQIKKVFEVVKALPGVRVFKDVEEADAYLDKIQKGTI